MRARRVGSAQCGNLDRSRKPRRRASGSGGYASSARCDVVDSRLRAFATIHPLSCASLAVSSRSMHSVRWRHLPRHRATSDRRSCGTTHRRRSGSRRCRSATDGSARWCSAASARERIQFNEATIWTGGPHEYARPGASRYLTAPARRCCYAGRRPRRRRLAQVHFMSAPLRQRAYQAFGDLRFDVSDVDSTRIEGYRRELDLDSAVATTRFRVGRRDLHAAGVREPSRRRGRRAADAPTGRAASRSREADERASLASPQGDRRRPALDAGNRRGRRDRVRGAAARARRGRARPRSPTARPPCVARTSATVMLAGATNFVSYADVSADPDRAQRCDDARACAARRFDDAARGARGGSSGAVPARSARPRRERTRPTCPPTGACFASKQVADPALAALFFQYGRYLLIASSRAGGQPANLQGLWNDSNTPPWDSKYTVNINTEMNYWPAEPANLAELHRAAVRSCCATSPRPGASTAREHYGARGWVLHHNTDLWRGTAPINDSNHGIWPTGGAWLCQHLVVALRVRRRPSSSCATRRTRS